MNDLNKAKKLLMQGEYTCVLCKGDSVITTNKRGVLPLVEWIENDDCFDGYSVADKVVGKAAALLYVKLNVKKIYAPVISKGAAQMLEKYHIEFWCDTVAEAIINRRGDGFCPMETAVKNINTPEKALAAIKSKLNEL